MCWNLTPCQDLWKITTDLQLGARSKPFLVNIHQFPIFRLQANRIRDRAQQRYPRNHLRNCLEPLKCTLGDMRVKSQALSSIRVFEHTIMIGELKLYRWKFCDLPWFVDATNGDFIATTKLSLSTTVLRTYRCSKGCFWLRKFPCLMIQTSYFRTSMVTLADIRS